MTLRQCKSCPWKAGASVDDIPRYSRAKHRSLASTIAEPGSFAGIGGGMQMMQCHGSTDAAPMVCVGWLAHQIGPGNNLALRLRVATTPSLRDFVVDGPQRETFAETFARRPRKAGAQ